MFLWKTTKLQKTDCYLCTHALLKERFYKDNIFGKCNIVLFIFNLLPIYPLDGYNIIKLFINDTMLNNLVIISLVILLIFAIYNNSLGLLFIISTLIYKNIIYYKEKDKIYLLNLVNNMV